MVVLKYAYVGTYGPPNGTGEGIYVFRVDGEEWTQIQVFPTKSPSFLCFNSARDRLYAVNEVNESPEVEGTLTTFSVDPKSGEIGLLSSVSTGGVWPCHLCLDQKEKHVVVANYKSGSVGVFPIFSDGRVTHRLDLLRFSGCSEHRTRQEGPHSHFVNFYPQDSCEDEDHTPLHVVDLGLDRVFLYNFNYKTGSLKNIPITWWKVPGGAGARHTVVHKKFLYVINELNNTISVFGYNRYNPGPPLQNISTLPLAWNGNSACAEIMLHPSGKFLYGSNRGHDSIVIFKISEDTGLLTLVGIQSTKGKTPRHFQIEGDFLYAGNQDSNTISVFKINPDNGELIDTGKMIDVPSPVCIVFSH